MAPHFSYCHRYWTVSDRSKSAVRAIHSLIRHTIGEYGNFDGPTLDYQFCSLTASHNGFYGKVGMWAEAFDGNYYKAGYGNNLIVKDVDLFDYAIAAIHSDSTLLGGESDTNLVFTLSKTFSF